MFFIAAFTQAPQGFNYQAVVRDTDGDIIADSPVGVQISIIKDAPDGTVEFVEEHTVSSNAYGLITLVVGSVNTVDFANLNWAGNDYFIQIDIDVDGGTDYVEMGTSQLISVPYALHARTAEAAYNALTAVSAESALTAVSAETAETAESVTDGSGSGLDADLLDGQDGSYYLNASNIDAGTLSTTRYDAYDELSDAGRLDNNSSTDLLTRTQADARYQPQVAFFARNTVSDDYTTVGPHKLEFNVSVMEYEGCFNNTSDQFVAPALGVYNFSAGALVTDLATGSDVYLYLYVNNLGYCMLASTEYTQNTVTLSGSATLRLEEGDYVTVHLYCSDAAYTVSGTGDFGQTWFSGHLVFANL